MRVLVVGASGVIGVRLVPRLLERGHQVIGTFTRPEREEELRALGAEPVRLDLLDRAAVVRAVLEGRPEAIVDQATALANGGFSRRLDHAFALTNRLRTEGTDNLLLAARRAEVRRLVAQSFAPYRYARVGSMVKGEDEPLDANPAPGSERTQAAMAHLERSVTDFGGIALRYGGFYGGAGDPIVEAVRRRRFPIIGSGQGMTSFVHLDDAAAATVLALEHEGPGLYNVVDDEPAPLREWLPALALALGAKPPRHLPRWAARPLAGRGVVLMATQARGACNARAKRELGWRPLHPSWRQGFVAAYSPAPSPSDGAGRSLGGGPQ